MSEITIKFKKALGLTRLAPFDTQPSWGDLASRIFELYNVSPENVSVTFFDEAKDAVTITREEELQHFYKRYYQSSKEIKFVVQDLQFPDPSLASTWSADSNLSGLSGDNDDRLTLFCWVFNMSNSPFPVDIGKSMTVGHLKKAIKKEKEHTFGDVDADTLKLWKLSPPIPSAEISKELRSPQQIPGCVELDATNKLLKLFPSVPDEHLHIIVEAPPTPLKRRRDDPTDISRKLFDLWKKPMKRDLQHLRGYLEKPLDPDWRVPLSHAEWKAFLVPESISTPSCSPEDLEHLFKECEDETAVAILELLRPAIFRDPVNPSGTESSLHWFWDNNIRAILERCLGVASIRDSQRTNTGSLRPDFGLLLANVCVFRGEEKRIQFTGRHPRDELKVKTRWVYDPAPYILGYHAIGVEVVLAAILPPAPQGKDLRVGDLISANLSTRSERIKNASRMIKLCGVLRWLQQVIGEGKDRDMFVLFRDGGKSIEYFSSHVRKTYGLPNSDDGKEHVEHLIVIYALLRSKGVPNVDRLKKAEIQHHVHGSYVDLEHRGINEGPKSPLDVRHAVVCVLEALKVAHADPPVFHRDIRWPNIVQCHEGSSKWFLIDWEDGSSAPTKAAPHLSHVEHSPNVYKDDHGAEVDIWAVGRLIFTAQPRAEALMLLGRRMMEGDILNAEEGLEEIRNIPLSYMS